MIEPILRRPSLRTLLLLTVLLCGMPAAGATSALSRDVVPGQLQVLEDASGEATFEQVLVRRDRFSKLTSATPHYHFTSSAYWFRLPVENRRDRSVSVFLDIKHPTLDYVTLHVLRADGNVTTVRSGDRLAARARPHPATSLVLPFALAPGETAELFLRVRADAGALIVPFEILELEGLQAEMLARRLLHGALLGLFGALFLYNLLAYLTLRDRSHLYYVVYLPFALLTITSLDGFGPSVLYPAWTWPGNEGLVVFSGVTFFLILSFTRAFLETHLHPDLDRWIKLLLGINVLLAISPLFLPIRVAYELDMLMVFVFPLVCCLVGFASWRRGKREARFYVLGQAASWIGLVLFGLLIYDVLPFHLLLFEAISLGIAADALLLALALADRIRRLQGAKLEAENSARRNLEVRKEKLERLIAARTAELDGARREAERLATTDALTGIANRRGLLEPAEREIKLALRNDRPLAVVMFDLDHFKRVNDSYGHAEGDRVLRDVVTAALQVIRDTDLFGRVGGEEFLAVLPDTTEEAAVVVAERIRERIGAEVVCGVPPQPVTASFGVAGLKAPKTTLAALEAAADAALYGAKHKGRNRVETSRSAA